MKYPFIQRHYDGATIWRAGSSVYGLCAAWNHATCPDYREHVQAIRYARAIKARMMRLGLLYGVHYRELSNGELFPNRHDSVKRYIGA